MTPQNNFKHIEIIGAGAVGSWLALFLTRAQLPVLITDFDRIEEKNIAGQFFNKNQLHQYKIDALKANIDDFSTSELLTTQNYRYEKLADTSQIVISAVDSMSLRQQLFDDFLAHPTAKIFIDCRMAPDTFSIAFYSKFKRDDADLKLDFSSHYFEDFEEARPICSFVTTTHTVVNLASRVAMMCTMLVANHGDDFGQLPFIYEFNVLSFRTSHVNALTV